MQNESVGEQSIWSIRDHLKGTRIEKSIQRGRQRIIPQTIPHNGIKMLGMKSTGIHFNQPWSIFCAHDFCMGRTPSYPQIVQQLHTIVTYTRFLFALGRNEFTALIDEWCTVAREFSVPPQSRHLGVLEEKTCVVGVNEKRKGDVSVVTSVFDVCETIVCNVCMMMGQTANHQHHQYTAASMPDHRVNININTIIIIIIIITLI